MSLLIQTVRLATPSVLENLLNSGTFLVDGLMVASLGADALAAVGIVGVFLWRLNFVFGCTRVGAGAMVSRRWGEGNFAEARRVFTHCTVLSMIIAAFLWGLLPFLRPLMGAFFAPGSALDLAVIYFKINLLALPFHMSAMNMASCLRAAGDTRTPLVVSILVNLVNVLLNYMLIFGKFGAPEWGLFGAAVATALASTLGFLVLLGCGLRGLRPRRLFPAADIEPVSVFGEEPDSLTPARHDPSKIFFKGEPFRFSRAGIKPWIPKLTPRLLRISHPVFWEEVAITAGFVGFIWMIARFGEVAVAAHTATIRLESFSFQIGHGIAAAVATLVGQSLGAGSVDTAKRVFTLCLTLAISAMSIIGIILALFPEWLVGWFTAPGEMEFLSLAVLILLISSLEQPLVGSAMVLSGGLRGAGHTRAPFIAQLIGTIPVRLGLGYFLAFPMGMGVVGLIWATVADWGVRTIYLAYVLRRGKWAEQVV